MVRFKESEFGSDIMIKTSDRKAQRRKRIVNIAICVSVALVFDAIASVFMLFIWSNPDGNSCEQGDHASLDKQVASGQKNITQMWHRWILLSFIVVILEFGALISLR